MPLYTGLGPGENRCNSLQAWQAHTEAMRTLGRVNHNRRPNARGPCKIIELPNCRCVWCCSANIQNHWCRYWGTNPNDQMLRSVMLPLKSLEKLSK